MDPSIAQREGGLLQYVLIQLLCKTWSRAAISEQGTLPECLLIMYTSVPQIKPVPWLWLVVSCTQRWSMLGSICVRKYIIIWLALHHKPVLYIVRLYTLIFIIMLSYLKWNMRRMFGDIMRFTRHTWHWPSPLCKSMYVKWVYHVPVCTLYVYVRYTV